MSNPLIQINGNSQYFGAVWGMCDIRHTAFELGLYFKDEEYFEIRDIILDKHDSEVGITWDVIKTAIKGYYDAKKQKGV